MSDLRQRLVAILAADAAGYSRLMALDEHATLALLDASRSVFRSSIEAWHGRVIDMAGDSVLAIFDTANAAVSTALTIQQELAVLAADLPPDRRMRFRIGVHLGDVIEKGDGSVYGDGVNIAARLEGLAEPGGVAVSDSVRNAVFGKVAARFDDQGHHAIKNISEPVRVFRATVVSVADRDSPSTAGVAAAPAPLPTSTSTPAAALEKPSLAVLPFTNLSGDPEQEYIVDGVVDDIITALSRVRAFFVMARNSSFTYKGKAVDIKQVGRELGVRYVLEGSIRRSGQRVRIVGQLIDADSGRHIWAERFEGKLDDIFDLQDRITESVVGAIEPSLRLAEIERARAKPTENLRAYDLCLRALATAYSNSSKDDNDAALAYLRRAIAMDGSYTYAKGLGAWVYGVRCVQAWATPADLQEGIRLAEEALADHRDDPATLTHAGNALGLLAARHVEALHALDRALQLNPNSSRTQLCAGWLRCHVGETAVAIEHFRRAIHLSPLDPELGRMISGRGFAYAAEGRYEDALAAALESLPYEPNWLPSHRLLIICYMSLGRTDQARAAASRLIALAPAATVSRLEAVMPFKVPAFRARYLDSLRAAGVPE